MRVLWRYLRHIKLDTMFCVNLQLLLLYIIPHWTLGDSDTQHDEAFLNDLIAAYKVCTKENNGSSVTIDHLANKYLETHSNEEYKRNLKDIGLKMYLVQSNLFTVTEKIVTITEGIHYTC